MYYLYNSGIRNVSIRNGKFHFDIRVWNAKDHNSVKPSCSQKSHDNHIQSKLLTGHSLAKHMTIVFYMTDYSLMYTESNAT